MFASIEVCEEHATEEAAMDLVDFDEIDKVFMAQGLITPRRDKLDVKWLLLPAGGIAEVLRWMKDPSGPQPTIGPIQ